MGKLIRLSSSGIEYLDYAWGVYSGCLNWQNGICAVEKCWAKGTTERFKRNYPNGFGPTYYPQAFLSPLYLKKPSRISVGWMGDLFGDWVYPKMKLRSVMPSGKASAIMSLKGWIFTTIEQCPQHTFLFLTKRPQNLIKWSPFPDNCQVGVTATDARYFAEACGYLRDVEASVKYLSIEPYLGMIIGSAMDRMLMQMASINWLIIGAQTRPYKPPKIEWVKELVEAADRAGIPVFLKDNLRPLFEKPFVTYPYWAWRKGHLRQEVP